ncbi:MAG TPA: hypothetical protein VHM31_22705 [Polyangia bacterium]|nr:hypothetical protein [Polyangia bacterium]
MRASFWLSLARVVMVLGLATASCGSSSSSNPDSFVGSWTFQSGSIHPGCGSIPGITDIDLTGDAVTITKVDSSHIAMVVAATGAMCDVRFAVDGNTATAESGQTCAISDAGYSATLNVTRWTLSMNSGTITMSMSGTATVSIIMCAPTSTGTMVRGGSDAAQGG